MNYAKFKSPIGWIEIRENEDKIMYLVFHNEEPQIESYKCPLLTTALTQLEEYFQGKRKSFELPLMLKGTAFRMKVWQELTNIPYGKTITYGALAKKIGNSQASRAVGQANHHNPVSIIVPCHRVIGADGGLTGYGGELWRKEWLLKFEAENK
jgi:methylated-DNA-[protein]-cysteine S-methyltransferase